MRTYKLHMIRHGLTEANTDGRYIGVTDVPLSAVGIDWLQSQRKEGFYPAADIVFSSPLARCTETVGIIYPDKEPYLIDELREYDFGEFENKTADELDGTDNYMDWISGKIPSPPGGEDPTEFTKRHCLGLNRVVKTMMEKQVFEAAAVMHGGVIMSLFAAAALPRRRPVEWTCDPGTGFTVRITPSLYAKSGVIEVIDTIPAQSTADASFDEE